MLSGENLWALDALNERRRSFVDKPGFILWFVIREALEATTGTLTASYGCTGGDRSVGIFRR